MSFVENPSSGAAAIALSIAHRLLTSASRSSDGIADEAAAAGSILVDGGAPAWAEWCGNIAALSTMCIRLAPIPTVIQFVQRRNIGSLPLMPYTALFADSILWLSLGLMMGDPKIIVTHVFCAVLAATYGFFYARTWIRSGRPQDTSIIPGTLGQHAAFVTTVAVCTISAPLLLSMRTARDVTALAAVCGTMGMYAGPLAAIRAVIREKDASSIPLPYTAACVSSSIFWFLYGWFAVDEMVLYGPSAIGFCLTMAQVYLIAKYGQRGQKENVGRISGSLNGRYERLAEEPDGTGADAGGADFDRDGALQIELSARTAEVMEAEEAKAFLQTGTVSPSDAQVQKRGAANSSQNTPRLELV